jgi:ABC-type Fe3+ transport system substrate-binding protein
MYKSKIVSATICLILFSMLLGCAGQVKNKSAVESAPVSTDKGVANPTDKADNTAAEWSKVVEAAKKEGKLVLAGPPGAAYRDALMEFTKAYPEIQIDYNGLSGREFSVKADTEQKIGKYLWDVLVGGTTSIITDMLNKGIITEFPRDLPETLPSVNDKLWRSGFDEGFADTNKKIIYAFSAYTRSGVIINRDFISEDLVSSVQDLLKPEVKGKIAWFDPRSGGPGNGAAAGILRAYGDQFLRKVFTEQGVVITNDSRQQNDWLVRGRYPISVGADLQFGLGDMQDKGIGKNVVPLNDKKIQELVTGYGAIVSVKNAPHSNAAKVFINWLLSKEGQKIWSEKTRVNSRRLDVPIAEKSQAPDPNIQYTNAFNEEYVKIADNAAKIAKELLK